MKILLVNPNNIGDVVLATPILDALHILFPGSEITFVAQNRCKGVLSGDNRISHLFGFDFSSTSFKRQNLTRFFQALRAPWIKQSFDLAILTSADIRISPIVRSWIQFEPLWGLVDRATNSHTYGLRDWLRSGEFLLTSPVYNDDPLRHEVERLWLIVKSMDKEALLPEKPFLPKITPKPANRKLDFTEPFMVLHPGANIPTKRYPIKKMAHIAMKLRSRFSQIVVVGSKEEFYLGEQLAALTGCVENRCGAMSLDTIGSVISRASLYLGNDTGPTHMAAALGVPVVSIVHGESQALRWGPYRPNDETAKAVWHEDSLVPDRSMNPELVWRSLPEHEVLDACVSVLDAVRSKTTKPHYNSGVVGSLWEH